jgi:uncharacterized protein YhhL (DUF1145 family)
MSTGARDPRIDGMYSGDRRWSLVLVALLWAAILFVLLMTWPYIADGPARIVAVIAGGLLLLFNTASILAMLSHYGEDKDHIYGLDLKYLDAMRKR